MAQLTIRPAENGPYIVEGAVDLFDTEGNKIIGDRSTIALCRRGASSNNHSAAAHTAVSAFRQRKQQTRKALNRNTQAPMLKRLFWLIVFALSGIQGRKSHGQK